MSVKIILLIFLLNILRLKINITDWVLLWVFVTTLLVAKSEAIAQPKKEQMCNSKSGLDF